MGFRNIQEKLEKVPFSTWRCSSCHHEKSQLITRGLGARNDMGFTSNSKPLYTSFIIWVRNSSRNFYQVEYHGIREKIWTIWLIFCHKLILPQVNAVFITYLCSLSCLTLFLLAIGEISPLIVYCLTKLGRNMVVYGWLKLLKYSW